MLGFMFRNYCITASYPLSGTPHILRKLKNNSHLITSYSENTILSHFVTAPTDLGEQFLITNCNF